LDFVIISIKLKLRIRNPERKSNTAFEILIESVHGLSKAIADHGCATFLTFFMFITLFKALWLHYFQHYFLAHAYDF
jgi:hypothetical protein